jgi:formylglycine-generating enzyme required for sulfatase activity
VVTNKSPSNNKGCDECPVENVSWNDAQQFITSLNNASHEHYRLPTEAEWEFAARGGTVSITGKFHFSGSQLLEQVGWFVDNSGGRTHPEEGKAGNELGIVNMSGNVSEWCSDWYEKNWYSNSPPENPQGPSNGTEKAVRGGSWNDYDQFCRNTSRDKHDPGYKNKTIGFRIAKDAPPK